MKRKIAKDKLKIYTKNGLLTEIHIGRKKLKNIEDISVSIGYEPIDCSLVHREHRVDKITLTINYDYRDVRLYET